MPDADPPADRPTVPALHRRSSLGYQVNHLARLLEYTLRERIKPLGVVPGQYPPLLALYETDGLTQTELCERVQVEQPTMANTLARMQRDGLITREPDPDDRRRTRVLLTPHARALEPQLAAAARSGNAAATRGLTDDEVETFMTTIATIATNLKAASVHTDGNHTRENSRSTRSPPTSTNRNIRP